MLDSHLKTLDRTIRSAEDHRLALRHAPRIRFDTQEPFLPLAAGYTVFRQDSPSLSFARQITLPPGAACVIEYAVWWDWDIEHLYELEHIWVYLDADEKVVAGDASWHGSFHVMADENGQPPLEQGRLTLHSEPGKHAFAPAPQGFKAREMITRKSCGVHAGKLGVHVTPLFEGIIHSRKPLANRLVHTYLEQQAFSPAYDFARIVELESVIIVPWDNLFRWIPARVDAWIRHLRETIAPHERRVMRIAHRGASAYAPENSLLAFRKASELGADMVEVDIRATADDIPVVVHDPSLKRVFGVQGSIADFTLAELRAILPPGVEPVPTFEEVVQTCRMLWLGLYLDIKHFSLPIARAVFDSLEHYGLVPYVIFGSFRADWLADIKAHYPAAATSILFSSAHIDPVLLARSIQCDYIHPCWERLSPQPHTLLTSAWMQQVRDADLGIVCWHEERPAEIAALSALGVDGICSDKPELLLPARNG